ncbi:MAG: hypothetical protein JXA14_27075 [Anaerolineae bacterium]|nr:hypothetical protein [Anaerolineae bacterium]
MRKSQAAPIIYLNSSYLEYGFWRDGERLADPLNPRTVPTGMGHDKHCFYMPDAAPTPSRAAGAGLHTAR